MGQGLKGKEGERMREKRVGGKGAEAHSKHSDFGTLMIWVLYSGISSEAGDSHESLEGSRTEPFFSEMRFGALQNTNCRFEAIRANHSNATKKRVFLRMASRESPRFALRIVGPSKQRKVRQNPVCGFEDPFTGVL